MKPFNENPHFTAKKDHTFFSSFLIKQLLLGDEFHSFTSPALTAGRVKAAGVQIWTGITGQEDTQAASVLPPRSCHLLGLNFPAAKWGDCNEPPQVPGTTLAWSWQSGVQRPSIPRNREFGIEASPALFKSTFSYKRKGEMISYLDFPTKQDIKFHKADLPFKSKVDNTFS